MAVSQRRLNVEVEGDRLSRAYLFPTVASLVALLFLAAPWSLEHKAHVALHGLCAQRPSHSFVLGANRLPFDARMTGIYGGFLGASIYLGLRRRYRAAGLPSWPTIGILVLFVGLMGIDGFNSLFLDMGWRYFYEPDNRLRLLTGSMTGVALAAAIFMLIGMALWTRPRLDQRVVLGVWEAVLLLALQVPFGLAVLSGWSWLFVPITLALLVTATAVVSAMMLVVLVMAKTADNSFETVKQVEGYAVVALLAGVAVMAAFGGGRFLLESLTRAPPLT
ncbi:MAG TPA: DUF2085 domain-containing protein [Thermomicrobiales bacterium]